MSSKPTIKDIAKRAGVGTTTVSRVLNNHPYVSEEKRQKVLQVMDEMSYRPNASARDLRRSSTGLIGFLTDDVATTPYAVEIIKGAQDVAWQHNMILLVVDTGKYQETANAALEMFVERKVEGIIYAAMYHRPVKLPDALYDIPTVLANCFVQDARLPSAVPDEAQGGFDATELLIQAGHERIAFINLWEIADGIPPPLPAISGRLVGYKKALAQYNLPFKEAYLHYTDQSPATNHRIAGELMALPEAPTAIFCGNDRMAMACYSVLSGLGLRIPEDVAIVGFDNQVDIAGGLLPPLSTIQLPHYEMGVWAAEYLIASGAKKIANPPQHKIYCPVVERESV